MLSISLPHFHDVTSRYKGITRTLLRKEPPMKNSLSYQLQRYVRQLVKLAALTLLATPVFAQTYTITDLGTLGTNTRGNYSIAYCINNSGQVAGESSAPSHQFTDPAFLYSNGQLINIGTLGGEYGQPRGINTSGQIAGYSTLATGSYRAFIYTAGQMTDIGTLGADYSVAYALNDSGQVVGNSAHLGGQDHAFLYSNGQMTDLGTLGGDTSNAYGINNLGVIAGYSYNSVGRLSRLYLPERHYDSSRYPRRQLEHRVCDQRPEPDHRPGLHAGQPCRARVPPQRRANGRPWLARRIEFLGAGDQQQRYRRGVRDHSPKRISRFHFHQWRQNAGLEQAHSAKHRLGPGGSAWD